MSEITIEPARNGDLAEILRNFERFWRQVADASFLRYLMRHPLSP
jgi:hypothetical protein